jgi:hypothetical protein
LGIQVFFEVSERQTRLSSAVVLIASDFILTINVFSLLYAQPLGWGLYLYGAPSTQVTLVASVTTQRAEVDKVSVSLNRSRVFPEGTPHYNITFDMALNSAIESEETDAGTLRVKANTPDVFLPDVLSLASRTVQNSVISAEKYFSVKRDNEPVEKLKILSRTSEVWKNLNEDDNAEEKEEVTLSMPAFGLPRSRMLAYSVVYKNVDEVQDGFPASILEPMSYLPVSGLNRLYYATLSESAVVVLGC